MKLLLATIALAGYAAAQDQSGTYGGTGPYKSYFFEVESLANHTFYQPLQSGLGSSLKLPVIVFGNGGCIGLMFRGFLGEVASWGALVIATGPVFTDPIDNTSTPSIPSGDPAASVDLIKNPGALTAAIDWVYANSGKGDWKHIDASRIGAWGQSCGGVEAYDAGAFDKRVGHLGIFDSGLLSVNESVAIAGNLTKPVFYIIGGPTDIAYPNAERDYANLPRGTPSWFGNHALGHYLSFNLPNAGPAGIAGRYLLQWLLRGDAKAKQWFLGDGSKADGFTDAVYKNLDSIKVSPIQ